MQPYFIVGSGRCGSTMLSNLLNAHPDILSLSEFFVNVTDLGAHIPQTFTAPDMDGAAFWQKIAAIMPRKSLMYTEDIKLAENLYPYKDSNALYSQKTGVPAILQMTLPHLTEQHDALFNKLGDFIQQQPLNSLRWHYDNLFAWLANGFDCSVWVERSGGINVAIEPFCSLYPDARYIHLLRDGRNTAMSMAKHTAFRLFMLAETMTKYLGVDPFISDDRTQIEQLPEQLRCFLPECFDAEAFERFRFPLQTLGGLWSQMMALGSETLSTLPPENVLTLSYEAFCQQPEAHLKQVTDFLGVSATAQWLQETAQNVKSSQASWLNLPESDQQELEAACREGMALMESLLAR